MSNMSYCRFRNTLGDLQDCFHAMREEHEDNLSEDERSARDSMVKLCVKIADEYGEWAE